MSNYYWRNVSLTRPSIEKIISAIAVGKLQIDPDDFQSLTNAYNEIQDGEFLETNQVIEQGQRPDENTLKMVD
jgi:hypothetical protein